MTNKEYRRLVAFTYAKVHAFRPTIHIVSKRQAKGVANAVGRADLLKGSIISNLGKIRYIKP